MESITKLDINTQPNPGEQVELWLESQESVVLVLAEADKVLSVTCVERVECSPQLKPTEDGTENSILIKRDMPLLQL